jgi:hypothetical protein
VLVDLRGHLLNRAAHALLVSLLLLVLVVLVLVVLVLEGRVILELRTRERSRGARLERGAKQKLRRQQRGELHVKSGSRSCHVGWLLAHGLCVDRRNVRSSRMPIPISIH